MRVRTTIQPDVELDVSPDEADSLRHQGLLLEQEYTGPVPAARVPRNKEQED